MDKEGIGTDATISEHIATIQNREYAKKTPTNRFTPTNIGLALVETYMYLQYPLYKPYLRAHMERECTAISEGKVHFQEVIDSCIGEMSLVYQDVNAKKDVFRDTFIQFLNKRIPELALPVASVAALVTEHLIPCVQCGGDLNLMAQKKGESVIRFLQCPSCGNSLSLPPKGAIVPQSARCPICSYSVLQIRSEKAGSDGFFVCPFCYSNPSSHNAIDIENLPLGFTLPCFKCNHACPFASFSFFCLPFPLEPEETPLCPCYACRNGRLLLRRPRAGGSFSVRCSNSACRCAIHCNPAILQDVQKSPDLCQRCSGFGFAQLSLRFARRFRAAASRFPAARHGAFPAGMARLLRVRARRHGEAQRTRLFPPHRSRRAALFPRGNRGLQQGNALRRDRNGRFIGRGNQRGGKWGNGEPVKRRTGLAGADRGCRQGEEAGSSGSSGSSGCRHVAEIPPKTGIPEIGGSFEQCSKRGPSPSLHPE